MPLKCAPSRYVLKRYGGDISDEEYRSHVSELPPVVTMPETQNFLHKVVIRTPLRKWIRLLNEVESVDLERLGRKKKKTKVTVTFADKYSFDFNSDYVGFQEAVELLTSIADSRGQNDPKNA